jgi:hypothetical protein
MDGAWVRWRKDTRTDGRARDGSSTTVDNATLLLIIAYSQRILHLFSHPSSRWVIGATHLLFMGILFWHQGAQVDLEAQKYLGCAHEVLNGDVHDLLGNYLKYASYVLFLLPFVALGIPGAAIAAQLALGLCAAFAFSNWVDRMMGSKAIGNIAMAMLLLSYPIQVWGLAMYTEHYFTSLTILFLERITRNGRINSAAIVIGLLVLFARPVGMLFVGPAFLWKLFAQSSRGFVLVLGCIALLAAAISIPGVEHAQLAPIAEGHVIAGVPAHDYEADDLQGSRVLDAQRFLINKLGASEWLVLTLERIASLFTLTRPWYSTGHNAFVSLFYVLYPLALLGIWLGRKDPMVRLVIAITVTYAALIGLTHDEWSGRFLVPLIPLIIVLASHAWLAFKPCPKS